MIRFVAFVALLLLVALGPNLLWLSRSTLYVENRGDSTVESVRAFACQDAIELGDLEPGESRLRLLPSCGDTTLSISTKIRAAEHQTCEVPVEASMTHVDAWFDSPIKGGCALGEPLLSPLLVTRLW